MTPLGNEQHLSEISSSPNVTVRIYGPDTDYLCIVTLTLEIWPWIKFMPHPWVKYNNCVNIFKSRQGGQMILPGRYVFRGTNMVMPI